MRHLHFVIFAFGFAISTTALAGDAPLVEHADGRPANFEKGETASYGVWHTSTDAWRLDVTTAGYRHHFRGRIWIEGPGHFGPVVQWKGAGEKQSEDQNDNWFRKAIVRRDHDREIVFDVVSEDKDVSGILFKVEGSGPVRWELGIGGPKDADPVNFEPSRVKIGHDGHAPPALPFRTAAHPDLPNHGG
jgi:hypothetical protein